jgi:hypothetical protein
MQAAHGICMEFGVGASLRRKSRWLGGEVTGADLSDGRGGASIAICKIIRRVAQLKCKDSPDVAQLCVEERGAQGDWLRLVLAFALVVAKVREEFALAPARRPTAFLFAESPE